jgi:hypothetical protein
MDQFNAGQIWDVVPDDGGILGGHCIYIVAFNATGPICMTWGQRQPMTWAFYDKYCDEGYGVVDDKDKFTVPNDPIDVSKLDEYLSEIANTPQPPQPPQPPPQPPEPSSCPIGNGFAKIGNFFCWLWGRKGRFSYTNHKA